MSTHSEHSPWPKKTIAATVKWRDVRENSADGMGDIWVNHFTDEESMKRFIEQPGIKVLGVLFSTDALMGTGRDFALWEKDACYWE